MELLYIKERRRQKGLSQTAFADALNINQTAVSQWERHVALPSCDKLPDIAAVLECEIGDLFVPPTSIISEQGG